MTSRPGSPLQRFAGGGRRGSGRITQGGRWQTPPATEQAAPLSSRGPRPLRFNSVPLSAHPSMQAATRRFVDRHPANGAHARCPTSRGAGPGLLLRPPRTCVTSTPGCVSLVAECVPLRPTHAPCHLPGSRRKKDTEEHIRSCATTALHPPQRLPGAAARATPRQSGLVPED